MKEIPLSERTVAAAKPGEENQRDKEMLVSDWTLAAVKQREEERRRNEQVEPAPVALEPTEEKRRATEFIVRDWNLAFKQKEEERRRKEQPAKAAPVAVKQDSAAEAKVAHVRAEAARRAKVEWGERKEAEIVFRAVEDSLQRERQEARAAPKSGIVRSRGAAKIIRGVLSTLTTVAIASAIGFGAGVYITPPDKADEFRALVDSKLEEINGLIQREWAAIRPKAKAPTNTETPIAPEAAPTEVQSAAPTQPAAEAPAAETEGQKDMPDANAAPPSAPPADSSHSQSAPAPAMSETPSNAEEPAHAKPVTNKAPVAKPHVKAPVKKAKPKPKPKPKPAEHNPKAEPAEQAPAAEAPAQQ